MGNSLFNINLQMNYSIQAKEDKPKVVYMPVQTVTSISQAQQYVAAQAPPPAPVPGPAPIPDSPELIRAKENVEKAKKRVKCLNWTLIVYGMIGVIQGAIFSVVCRKCAAGYIKRGSAEHNIPYDENVVSRDEYILHEAFKNVAMFMFMYSLFIVMKGKCGMWQLWCSKPDRIKSWKKHSIFSTIIITLLICAVGYQFCGTHDIMRKYKHHHHSSRWGRWGQQP